MKKYWQFFKNNFELFLEYRADLAVGFIIKMSVFFTFVLVWAQIEKQGNTISGYGLSGIAFYYLTAKVLDGVRTSQTARDLRKNILRGGLSAKLVKPFNPTGYFFAKHLARVVSETLLNVLFAMPILFIWSELLGFLNLSLQTFVQFSLLWSLACVFDFFLFLSVGYVAFWTKEAHGLQSIVKHATRFFVGELIPLDLLPQALLKFLNFLPFPYTLFLPIKILSGQISWDKFLTSIIILIVWIMFFFLLNAFLWKKGVKQYEAVGI